MKRYVLALLLIGLSVGVNADKEVDSLQTALIDSLQQQLQEMKLNEIVLQHALDKRGESERADSIAQANKDTAGQTRCVHGNLYTTGPKDFFVKNK